MSRFDHTFILSLIQLTPGRLELSVRLLRERLDANDSAVLEPFAARAAEAGAHASELAFRRRDERQASYKRPATELDHALDTTFRALHGQLDALSLLEQTAEPAARLRDVVFPRGLAPTIRAAFAEEVALAKRVLAHAETPDGAADLDVLPGVRATLSAVGRAAEALDAALAREEGPEVTHAMTVEALKAANARLAELVMAVLAFHHGDGEEAAQRRATLLEPIAIQVEGVRASFRRRRAVTDVDPATGEVLPAEGLDDGANLGVEMDERATVPARRDDAAE